MRRLSILTFAALLTATGGAFAQSSMGTDASGRFDGTPPLGTSPEYENSTTISIPLDPVETGSTGWSSNDKVDWNRCAPGARDTDGTRRASRACRGQ